jgi:hypothetical protein
MNGKKNMQKMMILTALLVLAGCATDTAGLRVVDLRDPEFFRTERTIPMTFPKIQMALFKHQDACGSAPEFSMDPRETNYATIIDRPAGAEGLEHAVLVDLVQYQATMMDDPRTKSQVYTYYADAAAEQRVDQLFNAILHPEVCPAK